MAGTKEAWVRKERRANRANKATRYKVVEGVSPGLNRQPVFTVVDLLIRAALFLH